MTISNSQKTEIIERIITGRTFSRSETLRDLLKYLFDAYLKGHEIKAVDIAIDLLKRKGTLNESDETIARVYVHKLRSKLDLYYSKEGANEDIIVTIPKGKYSLIFDDSHKAIFKAPKTINLKTAILAFLVLILINAGILWQTGIFSSKTINSIWKEFIEEKGTINLTLANPFFYTVKGLEDNSFILVRNFDINSEQELLTTPTQFLSDKYEVKPSEMSYFGNNNVTSLPMLFSALSTTKNKVELHSSLDNSLDKIVDHNTIALTSNKAIGIFKEFLSASSFVIDEDGILILKKENEPNRYFPKKSFNDYYDDYAFIVKLPTPKGKSLCLICDYHSIGIKGLMEIITDKDAEKLILGQSKSNYRTFPKYFELLVKVSGYQEQNLETEIIHFKSLD